MPRPRSPRRHSRSPRRQRDRRHRSSSSRSRSRSRSRGRMHRSPIGSTYKERRYSRDSPTGKVRRPSRRSPSPPPKQSKYGSHEGRRSRSYSPRNQSSYTSYDRRSRSPAGGYQDRRSGRSSPRNYRDQSPDYYQKPKDHSDPQQMPTYVVVNQDRSYSPERRHGQDRQQYDDQRDEPRDLDARLREMEARSPELTKPRVYVKDNYSRNSPRDQYGQSSSYEKNRLSTVVEYRRDDKSPDSYRDNKYRRESRDYQEIPRKDSYNDTYQGDRAYSPPGRERREKRRNDSPNERRRSKDVKYAHSPDRYHSPEPERSSYREDDQRRDRHNKDRHESDNHERHRRDEKYSEKKERSGQDKNAYDSQKSHRRQDSTDGKPRQDREAERERRTPTFDPSLVIVPRRKDEGRGGIFNRPEITMRPITDDPDIQPMPFEEKRVVAVMPGKQLPAPAPSERDLRRDYIELLARKGVPANDFEVKREKYNDLGLGSTQTLSSRFQGAASLDLLATLENFEINRTKNLERELELRREMDYLRERSPLRLSDSHTDLEARLHLMERKVEPKNPRDLRHDLESRRKQLKAERIGRVETAVSPRRSITKKGDKDSKLRMTSTDRRPVRERLGLSPGKKERRSLDRREVQESTELPDFRREVEELQKAQWMEDPKSVPKGPGYFEHDDRERSETFANFSRGRGLRRGRGFGYRGRISTRGRGTFYRGSFYGGSFRGSRGTYSSRFRGLGRARGISFRGRGRSSPTWKHDKYDENGKGKAEKKEERRGSSKPKTKRDSSSSRGDKHTSRKDDKKSHDSRGKRSDRPRDSSGSRTREGRDSRKDRR